MTNGKHKCFHSCICRHKCILCSTALHGMAWHSLSLASCPSPWKPCCYPQMRQLEGIGLHYVNVRQIACAPYVGSLARIFAALEMSHEHIAAEAARLLTRLWAPAAGRSGAGPWTLPSSIAALTATADPATINSADDTQAAHAAKSAALSQLGRSAKGLRQPFSRAESALARDSR